MYTVPWWRGLINEWFKHLVLMTYLKICRIHLEFTEAVKRRSQYLVEIVNFENLHATQPMRRKELTYFGHHASPCEEVCV